MVTHTDMLLYHPSQHKLRFQNKAHAERVRILADIFSFIKLSKSWSDGWKLLRMNKIEITNFVLQNKDEVVVQKQF